MSVYDQIPLSETTSFIVDNRGKTAPAEPAGIPLIATNCIDNNRLYPEYINVRYVSHETYENWFRSHPEPGDILLTLKGSQNGAVCLTPNPVNFAIAQDMVALRINNNVIDSLFVFAALRSPDVQAQIKNLDVSGVIPHLKKSDFDKLLLPYPDRKTQELIGHYYFNLSSKIDLLHRQNKTLEAMAEALFRQWFVEGTREDWAEGSLFDLITLVGGGTPKTSQSGYWTNEIPWLAGGDIASNHKGFVSKTEKSISKAGLDNSSARLIPKFSTVISARGTVGKFCLLAKDMAFSQSNYGIVPKIENCFFFTYLLVNHMVEHLQSAAYGSVFDTITTSTFRAAKFSIPPAHVIKDFETLVAKYFEKILLNHTQIETLEKLRDTLLPKLMSGEVRVS